MRIPVYASTRNRIAFDQCQTRSQTGAFALAIQRVGRAVPSDTESHTHSTSPGSFVPHEC
jgi:hypothetical protein